MSGEKKLTLLDFLDAVGAPPISANWWYETEGLWDEYASRLDPPKDCCIGDWAEVSPALRILAEMIRAGLFEVEALKQS
jgi:hypothetical protein